MEPNDYKVLLVVAGLAHYTRFGFAMKPTARSKFLGGQQVTIVKSNLTVRRSTLMPILMGNHLLGSNKRMSTWLGVGIKPSDRPTRLRSRWVRMGD